MPRHAGQTRPVTVHSSHSETQNGYAALGLDPRIAITSQLLVLFFFFFYSLSLNYHEIEKTQSPAAAGVPHKEDASVMG